MKHIKIVHQLSECHFNDRHINFKSFNNYVVKKYVEIYLKLICILSNLINKTSGDKFHQHIFCPN